jgi:hypothetical protein
MVNVENSILSTLDEMQYVCISLAGKTSAVPFLGCGRVASQQVVQDHHPKPKDPNDGGNFLLAYRNVKKKVECEC